MTRFNTFRFFKKAIFAFTLVLTATFAKAQGTLNDLAFLDGRWLGTYNGGPIEASWTAPKGNNIVGFIRMIKDDKPALYEIFAFEQTDNGPAAMVKHFKPGMISVEEKEVADRYKFIEAKTNQALFEKDDASVRIIYERRSPTQLVIQRGKKENDKWTFMDLFIFNKIP